jgi:DNA-binding MarR family transcriptional regulator
MEPFGEQLRPSQLPSSRSPRSAAVVRYAKSQGVVAVAASRSLSLAKVAGGVKDCLGKQVNVDVMATVEPLSPTEEEVWRAIMRIVKVVPRHLDSDLIKDGGLTASDYTTIMHLSEAPNRELRMSDLATATDLSASRMTRLVDDLQLRGLVTKTASSSDARGNVARLTPRGMDKLKSAWPVHLASVRRRFLDYLDPSNAEVVARALSEVAAHLEETPAEARTPR